MYSVKSHDVLCVKWNLNHCCDVVVRRVFNSVIENIVDPRHACIAIRATQYGHLKLLDYVRRGYDLDCALWTVAAHHCQITMLDYLYRHVRFTSFDITDTGDSVYRQWIRDHTGSGKCYLQRGAYRSELCRSLDTFKWFIENLPWKFALSIDIAIHSGDTEILHYATTKYRNVVQSDMYDAIPYGNLEVCKFIAARTGLIPEMANYAANWERHEIATWIAETLGIDVPIIEPD